MMHRIQRISRRASLRGLVICALALQVTGLPLVHGREHHADEASHHHAVQPVQLVPGQHEQHAPSLHQAMTFVARIDAIIALPVVPSSGLALPGTVRYDVPVVITGLTSRAPPSRHSPRAPPLS